MIPASGSTSPFSSPGRLLGRCADILPESGGGENMRSMIDNISSIVDEAEPLLDIEQAARFLNVSETSLRRWTNDGRLACLRVGRRRERRFRMADLLAFVEGEPAGASRAG